MQDLRATAGGQVGATDNACTTGRALPPLLSPQSISSPGPLASLPPPPSPPSLLVFSVQYRSHGS